MKIVFRAFIIGFFLSLTATAQIAGTANTFGSSYTIDSRVLNENREVQVYLPVDYDESETAYSVLYLLDGQLFFNAAISLAHKFKQSRLSPEFIIVGITSSYPQRFGHFSSNKDKFLEFMETELMPFIESSFRTNNENLFFGWEYAGSVGFHDMLNNGKLFSAYILASPYPIWDEIEVLDGISSLETKLFFAVSPNEYDVNHGVEKLEARLITKDIEGLDWTYLELENEEHHSTGYTTLYHGLRSYFKYYPEFQEDSFKKFISAGGLAYAYAYAKERGEKYGFSSELSSWSKYTIIRSAIRANDYSHFQIFADEFVTDAFIADMKYRSLDISNFYEENDNHAKALEIYKELLEVFPDSEDILMRCANAYEAIGNQVEAEKYLQRAREVSENK